MNTQGSQTLHSHSRARPGGGTPARRLRLVARRHRLPSPIVVLGGLYYAPVRLDPLGVDAAEDIDAAVVLVRGRLAFEDVGVDRDLIAGGIRVVSGIVAIGTVVEHGRRAAERRRW